MGIRFRCQACANKVNVKDFLAGKRGICPKCGARFTIPEQSEPEFLATPDEPEPEAAAAPVPAANPVLVVNAPQQPAGSMPVAAPIAAAAAAGHLPPLNSTQTSTAQSYAMPQFAAPQPAAPQQPAAPYQNSMPIPGFHAAPVAAGPRDPFQEAPAAQWYVRHASGQQYGPAPVPTMQKWLAEGRVPGDGMVWREGWGDWQVASLVFPQLAPRSMPAPRGPMPAPYPAQPGMFPAPSPAATVAENPFDFGSSATSGTVRGNGNALDIASQIIHKRRDNSKMLLIISIVLLFAIALVSAAIWFAMNPSPEAESDEEVAWQLRLNLPSLMAEILV